VLEQGWTEVRKHNHVLAIAACHTWWLATRFASTAVGICVNVHQRIVRGPTRKCAPIRYVASHYQCQM
jgi:hypothetical protein